MRLRVECTTEPFDLTEAPPHALAARKVVESGTLDAVDVGPFGNTAEGEASHVLQAVDALLHSSLAAGATRISLQVSVLPEEAAESADEPRGAATADAAGDDVEAAGAGER